MAITQTSPIAFEQDSGLTAIDVFGMLRRRKWAGVATGFVGLCLTVTVALIWPSTYESVATILIEESGVPSDLVKSTVSAFATDRLQVIQQRVMTTQNLSDMIDRFGLYQNMLASHPRSEVIDKMRNAITLEVVSANLYGSTPPKNQPQQTQQQQEDASIAFTVAFDHPDPTVAQKVASRLTDLYLAENVQTRQEKAAGTTEFMTQQSEKLYQDVKDLQDKLAAFQTKYAGALPEQLNANMQILDQLETQLMQSRRDYESMTQKKSLLSSQLSQLSPYSPMMQQGTPATPQAQLMALELQYVDASARYGPKHPDVIHLKTQIDSLKAQLGSSADTGSGQAQLSQLQAQLSQALQRYGENHPTVQGLRKQIADLQGELAKAPAASMITTPNGPPDNPMYVQVQSQLADAASQLQGAQAEVTQLEAKISEVQARVLQTPAIESEYNSLQNLYDAAVKRYQDFKEKESDALVAQNMEQQSKGETFSVIEAPQLPDVPVSPNRKILLVAGFMLSCMMAGSMMLALEMMDTKVYESRGLQMVFGEAPLATVPYITTRRERTGRWIKLVAILLLIAGVIAGALAIVDSLVMPIDVLWAAFVNRVNP